MGAVYMTNQCLLALRLKKVLMTRWGKKRIFSLRPGSIHQRDAIGVRKEVKQKGQWKKCCKGYESTCASRLTGKERRIKSGVHAQTKTARCGLWQELGRSCLSEEMARDSTANGASRHLPTAWAVVDCRRSKRQQSKVQDYLQW